MGDGEVGFKKLSQGLQTFIAILAIIGAIVPCVLGFVNLDRRVDDVELSQVRHEDSDSKKWTEVWEDVDDHGENITDLRLSQIQLETQFLEIIRRLDELKAEIERWEPSPRG